MIDTLKFKVHKRDAGTDSEFYISYILDINNKILKIISNDDSELTVIGECIKFAQKLGMSSIIENSDKRVHHWDKKVQYDKRSLYIELYHGK